MPASPSTSASVPSDEAAQRAQRGTQATLLVALIVTIFAASHAWTKGPYSQHVDEHHLLSASHTILKSGHFDPGWYRYGSVSIHLCVLGEALGYLDDSRKNAWKPVSELPKSVVPLMRPERLGSWPRLLFALVGGAAALLAGLCAHRLRPAVWTGPLAILLLAAHPTLREQWYGYLNVNIVATFFAMVAIWVHLSAPRNASFLRGSALAAALWGAAAAAKYPVGIGVLSVVAAELWTRRRYAGLRALGAIGVALLAFLVMMPFALTNTPGFLSDLAFELSHYAKGHRDFTSEPGLESAGHHVKAWLFPLGPAAVAVAIGGFVALRQVPRKALALIAPTVVLLVLLALQATNFIRNSLLLGYSFSILAAVGVVASYPWLVQRARQLKSPLSRRAWAVHLAVSLPLLALVLGPHVAAYVEIAHGHQESRDALELQFRQLPQGAVVAIPHADFMTSHSVTLVPYDPTALPAEALAQLDQAQAGYAVVPRKWARSRFRAEPSIVQSLERAQALQVPGRPMWRGGLDEVWVHWPFHPRGNPDIELVAIDRSQLKALAIP